jgi:hypothetical protein
MSQRTTLFLCPVDGCDMRFKSTYGRTQHICAKHPNFGINVSESPSRSDDTPDRGHRPVDSSPSSHTSQLDQADEHMVIDSDPHPIVSDDFLQPPMTYSPFKFSSPPPAFDDLLPFSGATSQSPAIHSPNHPHDRSSDADDSDIESTGHHSQATSPFLDDSYPADTADESATSRGAFTDYHLILNGKFIHLILNALY